MIITSLLMAIAISTVSVNKPDTKEYWQGYASAIIAEQLMKPGRADIHESKTKATPLKPKTEEAKPQTQPPLTDLIKSANPQSTVVPTTYSDALEYTKSTNNKVLFVFKSSWCGECGPFWDDTLTDQKVVDRLKELKITVLFPIDWDVNPNTMKAWGIIQLPTYAVVGEGAKVLKQGTGNRSPQSFLEWLKDVE